MTLNQQTHIHFNSYRTKLTSYLLLFLFRSTDSQSRVLCRFYVNVNVRRGDERKSEEIKKRYNEGKYPSSVRRCDEKFRYTYAVNAVIPRPIITRVDGWIQIIGWSKPGQRWLSGLFGLGPRFKEDPLLLPSGGGRWNSSRENTDIVKTV